METGDERSDGDWRRGESAKYTEQADQVEVSGAIYLPWLTKRTVLLIRKLNALFRRAKRNKSVVHFLH